MRRRSPLLLLLVLVPLAAGCGGDDAGDAPAGVLLEIITSAADGAPEGRLVIQSVDDRAGRVHALEPLPGGTHPRYHAPTAAPGRYRVYSDAGWGMLWTGRRGTAAPLLRGADYPATLVRLGKPYTLYVAAADPALPSAPVAATWAAEWRPLDAGPDDPFRPVDLAVEALDEGIVALRFPPTQWRAGVALRAVGRMSDDSVTDLLAYTVRDTEQPELPRMALVHPASQAPLSVYLVPPGPDAAPEATPVWVSVGGIPLDVVFREESYQGLARFEHLPTLGQALRVSLRDPARGGGGFLLDQEIWRRRQGVHLLAIDPEAPTVALPAPEGTVQEVRVRPQGQAEFALAPARTTGDGRILLAAVPGRQDLLVGTTDGRWRHDVLEVAVEDGAPRVVMHRAGTPLEAVRVRGTARGAGPGGMVRFVRLLEPVASEDGEDFLPAREAAGEGCLAAVTMDGAYELHLPPGRYRVQILTATGPRGRVLTQTLRPGADVRLQLSTR